MKIDDKILQSLNLTDCTVSAIYLGENQWEELKVELSKRDCNINSNLRSSGDLEFYGYTVIQVKLTDYLRTI